MSWIEWCHPFHCIFIGSQVVSKIIPYIANFKSPSRPLHLQSELLWRAYIHLLDALNSMVVSIFSYLRWLSKEKWKRSKIALFKSPSTEPFPYCQTFYQGRIYTYLMRWIRWYCPFDNRMLGCGDMAKIGLFCSCSVNMEWNHTIVPWVHVRFPRFFDGIVAL